MSAAGRLAAQNRLRAIVARAGDAEAAELLAELIACAPASAPGQRTPATIAALAARDAALREAAARFGVGARDLANRMARYEATAWPRDGAAEECPPRHDGKLEGCLWRALKAVPRAIGERQMRAIVGNELPQFISERPCHHRLGREIDQCDSETKQVACRRR